MRVLLVGLVRTGACTQSRLQYWPGGGGCNVVTCNGLAVVTCNEGAWVDDVRLECGCTTTSVLQRDAMVGR